MRNLIMLILILASACPVPGAEPATTFRYGFQKGESFLIEMDFQITTRFSGNETSQSTTLQERMTIPEADQKTFTVNVKGLGATKKGLSQDMDLGMYGLLPPGKTSQMVLNRQGSEGQVVQTPTSSYESLYILPLPGDAIKPGHEWTRDLKYEWSGLGRAKIHQVFRFEKWTRMNGKRVAVFTTDSQGMNDKRNFSFRSLGKFAFDPVAGRFFKAEITVNTDLSGAVSTQSRADFEWNLKVERKNRSEEW